MHEYMYFISHRKIAYTVRLKTNVARLCDILIYQSKTVKSQSVAQSVARQVVNCP